MSDTESEIIDELPDYGFGIECKREYKNDILRKTIWLKDERKHREGDLPAEIWFHSNGNKSEEIWYIDDVKFRENDLPHTILYNSESKVIGEVWESDLPREDDKPSIIEYYYEGLKEAERWLINDVGFHRENDKPACIKYYCKLDENGNQLVKSMMWFVNGFEYRDYDLPSTIKYDEKGFVEVEKWIRNELLHRDNDQPAEIRYHEGSIISKTWYIEGVYQRCEQF